MATVTGGAGAQLHVVDAGNPRGRPIVFIHGFSQSWHAWDRQFASDLASEFRLIAFDMRGHGQSDKPRAGYDDSRLWADDLQAVLRELELDRPVLCGWSYGMLAILDYLRFYGEDAISGVNFVDGISKLGSNEAMAVISPELRSLVPGLFATDVEDSVRSLESLLRLFFARPPSADELCFMIGYNVIVPPYVRQALFSRSVDNDDLLPTLRTSTLITHGARDAAVSPDVVEQHRAAIAHAQVALLPGAGHAPFYDDPSAFNQLLRSFCASVMPSASRPERTASSSNDLRNQRAAGRRYHRSRGARGLEESAALVVPGVAGGLPGVAGDQGAGVRNADRSGSGTL